MFNSTKKVVDFCSEKDKMSSYVVKVDKQFVKNLNM